MINVRSDFIVEKMIIWATKHNDYRLKDLWLLSDHVRGIKRPIDKIVKLLDSFDQSKPDVQYLRKELHL